MQSNGTAKRFVAGESGVHRPRHGSADCPQQAPRWQSEVLQYAPGPDQLAALRLNALVVNPALTGLDYLERIARKMPTLALIAVSEPVPVAERVRGLRAGADDWITKPAHPEEVVARIQA